MCARCDAESADYAAKAEAAYAANGWTRLVNAIHHEDELVEQITNVIFLPGQPRSTATARAVIDAVREFDEQTALMREAKDDHDQQNNEDPNDPPY